MKETIKRVSCWLLVLCLMLTAFPFAAHAEEETEQVDFVLVLDCSGSMARNDKKGLAADACKKFMDLLPIENARIAVIAYGYNGKTYSYTHFNVKYDANYVQVLSGLNGDMTEEQVAALKKNITAATQKTSGSNPSSCIGQALAAGVDLLLKGGATDGNACVVLFSDGDATSPTSFKEAQDLAASVPLAAKKHEWPIFCIELDYTGKNETSAGKENRKRLTDICVNSGAGADGRMKVSDPADVTEALLKIFDRFMDVTEGGISEKVTLDKNGIATREFEVPQLASETNIIISGETVDYVEITTAKGVTKKISASGTEGDWIAKADSGSYISVKVLRPDAGTWTVKVHGDPNAGIHAYNSSIRELNMVLNGDPASPAHVTKNDKIHLQSYFTYGGGSLTNSAFYAENAAEAVVTSYNAAGDVKEVKSFTMTGASNGYSLDLPANELPSGKFEVQVLLKHDMFRSGQKTSNVLTYTSENLPLTHDESQNIDRTGYINADLDVIDLATVFPNPDGDPIEYEVVCVSDRNVEFDVNIDDQDYMYINVGEWVGTHQMQILATDPDMTEPLVHDFVITVENRPLETSEIPAQEVWVDYARNFLSKQDPSMTVLDLDLNPYFTDPDGANLVFGEITADVDGLVNASWGTSNGILHVEPLAVGDVVLTVVVSDGVEPVEAEIKVKVDSGVDIFWRTYRIYLIILIVLIVALVLFILYKNAHTTVKGSWLVTLKKGNLMTGTTNGLNLKILNSVKKAKHKAFAMKDMINDTLAWMPEKGNLKGGAPNFLNMEQFGKIKVKGVYNGRGFMVMNVPSDDSIEVEYKGQSMNGNKKFRVNGGELRITIKRKSNLGSPESMTILLESKGK